MLPRRLHTYIYILQVVSYENMFSSIYEVFLAKLGKKSQFMFTSMQVFQNVPR